MQSFVGLFDLGASCVAVSISNDHSLMSSSSVITDAIEIEDMVGFRIRRLQQITEAIFLEEAQGFGITLEQFLTMKAVQRDPGLDERALAIYIGIDLPRMGRILDGLDARWLVIRSTNTVDNRSRQLNLSPHGADLLQQIDPHMRQAQLRILTSLSPRQGSDFMCALQTLIESNNLNLPPCEPVVSIAGRWRN